MQCEGVVIPPCVPVGCATCRMLSAWTVLLSPTENPSKYESSTTSNGMLLSDWELTAAGSADQKTMLPPAPTGAIWKWTVVAPPPGVCTVTATGWLTMCDASACQTFL